MLQFFLGWRNLQWTRSQPLFHPLPPSISRDFIKTTQGPLELLISEPTLQDPKRTPVLFLHGGFGHASVWVEWMTYLSKHYNTRTYAVSARNHGASYVCSSWSQMVFRITLDDIASDFLAAIKEVELREGTPPVLVAHSAGGATVQYILDRGMAATPALVLAGSAPHYGFMRVLWNWLLRIDWWIFVRGFFMLQHPKSALCTTTLVKNAFFSPDYPYNKVREFEGWMAPYESLQWPAGLMGSWKGGRNVFLDPVKIVRNISAKKAGCDRILIIMGDHDHMMQDTQGRSIAEYAQAIKEVDKKRRSQTTDPTSGIRFVEIARTGHHLQNDVRWEEGAKALLDFLLQARVD